MTTALVTLTVYHSNTQLVAFSCTSAINRVRVTPAGIWYQLEDILWLCQLPPGPRNELENRNEYVVRHSELNVNSHASFHKLTTGLFWLLEFQKVSIGIAKFVQQQTRFLCVAVNVAKRYALYLKLWWQIFKAVWGFFAVQNSTVSRLVPWYRAWFHVLSPSRGSQKHQSRTKPASWKPAIATRPALLSCNSDHILHSSRAFCNRKREANTGARVICAVDPHDRTVCSVLQGKSQFYSSPRQYKLSFPLFAPPASFVIFSALIAVECASRKSTRTCLSLGLAGQNYPAVRRHSLRCAKHDYRLHNSPYKLQSFRKSR